MSHFDEKLQPWFSFDIPDDDAYFRLDLSNRKYELLVLAGLSGIASSAGAGVATSDGAVPVSIIANVGDDPDIEIVPASAVARKVSVYNNGPDDLIISEGGRPGFQGQVDTNPWTTGNFAGDFGIVLAAGDYFESPVAHKGAVYGRCRTGEGTVTSATQY